MIGHNLEWNSGKHGWLILVVTLEGPVWQCSMKLGVLCWRNLFGRGGGMPRMWALKRHGGMIDPAMERGADEWWCINRMGWGLVNSAIKLETARFPPPPRTFGKGFKRHGALRVNGGKKRCRVP